MIASLLALASGIGLGGSDWLGGRLSRSAPLAAVLVVSQVTGLTVLLLVLVAVRPEPPSWPQLLAGIGAGCCEIVGTAALYRGLSTGVTGIVAPIASTAPVVPLAAGALTGVVPGPVQLLGVVLVLGGVVLASVERGGSGARGASVRWGLITAVAFGGYLLLIGVAAQGGVVPALVATRSGAAVLLVAGVVALGAAGRASGGRRIPRAAVRGAVLVGLIITAADTAYAVSTLTGDLGLVAVLSSVHPVVTLLLARLLDAERIGPLRAAGVVVTVAGVVAITAS